MPRPIPAMIALVSLAGVGLVQPGCSEKTDCDKLRNRMNECSVDVWNALEPKGRGLMNDRWRRSRNRRHYQYCKRIKGVYKQSPAINECLAKKGDCKAFARCFCRAVKEASQCGRLE